MTVTTCRYCRRPILWRRSETTGKLAPIDPEPTRDGNVLLLDDGEHYRVIAPGAGSYGRPRHMNHFSTCPSLPPKGR